MIASLVTAAVATTKVLKITKIVANFGKVCIVAQPVVDEIKRRKYEG